MKEAIQKKHSRNISRAHFKSKYQSLHDTVKSHKTGKNLPRSFKLNNYQILHRAARRQSSNQPRETHRKHIKDIKGYKKTYHVNSNHKNAGVAIFISDKAGKKYYQGKAILP